MGGNVPEEDGVDHRVAPKLWLTDGSEEAPEGPEPVPPAAADASGDASSLPDMPLPASSNGTVGQDIPYPGQDIPYTGQQIAFDPTGTPAETAERGNSFGSSTAPDPYGPPGSDGHRSEDAFRVPPYQAQVPASQSSQASEAGSPTAPPYPAQVPPAPSAGMAARVTAPFAALTRPKTKKPPRSSRPAPPPAAPPSAPAAAKERVATASRTGNVPRGTAPTRRAQLVLARIEPWSVMKFSFMVSLVGWVILFVAVAALYYVLNKLGVFHSIQSTITDVTSSKGSAGADSNGQWFSASRILGYTMLVGAVNVVLITALATVGAVVYNLVTYLAGGIEVTLKETD